MLKLDDFLYGEVLDSKNLGQIVGGGTCACGDATCTSGKGERDVDEEGKDIDEAIISDK